MWIQWAGKWTQAVNIVDYYGYRYLESGGLLREIVKDESHKHHETVKGLMDEGKLVSDEIIFELIADFFEEDSKNDVLVDGAIRTINQKEFFNEITTDYIVINLQLNKEDALGRIQGRKIDPVTKEIFGWDFEGNTNPKTGNTLVVRNDDQDVEKIERRFSWYDSEIRPLLESWRQEGAFVYDVNAAQSRDDVWKDVQAIIDKYC